MYVSVSVYTLFFINLCASSTENNGTMCLQRNSLQFHNESERQLFFSNEIVCVCTQYYMYCYFPVFTT